MTQWRGYRVAALAVFVLAFSLGCPGGVGEKDVARFGAVIDLTGPLAAYGSSVRNGMDLAIEHLHADPEFPYEIEVEVADSGGDPAAAARLTDELYGKGVLAVVAGVSSGETLACLPAADKHGRVLISPAASSPELSGKSENFYRLTPSDELEGAKLGNFVVETLELDGVVVFMADTAYGRGFAERFQAELERLGSQVQETLVFPAGQSDFSQEVATLLELEAPAVLISGHWHETTAALKSLRSENYEGKVLTTSSFSTARAMAEAGASAEGLIFAQSPYDVSSDQEPIRTFVDSYQARFGAVPDFYAAHGYDTMIVLGEALKKQGPVALELWKGVVGLRSFPGVTGAIQFDEQGDVKKYPRIYFIMDGAAVDYIKYFEQRKKEIQERLEQIKAQQKRMTGGS
jgi:branched-chain amino acid transport system substrate-binding protein